MTCYGNGYEIMNRYIEYSGNEDTKNEIVTNFNKIYKDKENKTRTYTCNNEDNKETFTIEGHKVTYKTIQDYISAFIDVINLNRTQTLDKTNSNSIEAFCQRGSKANNIKVFKNKLKTNYEKIKRAGEEDVYYILAENMDNVDITNVVNLYDKKEKKIRESTYSNIEKISQEHMAEALEVMGQQYVQNVKTYNGSKTYTLTEISKNVDTAYTKNKYNLQSDLSIEEQKEAIKNKFDNLIENNINGFACGADCVRFMFSVMYYALDGNLGDKLSKNDSDTHYINIDSDELGKKNYDELFTDLGFKIFYIGKKYKDGVEDENGDEFGYEDLEDGDIVLAYSTDTEQQKEHVEFYINDKYGKNGNGTYDWGFGWGSKKSHYPVNGIIGKTIKVDENKSDEKKYYLLDNFTNLTYDGNNDNLPDNTYELRYFKVFRMKCGD